MKNTLCLAAIICLAACAPKTHNWNLMLSHTSSGDVTSGSLEELTNAVRSGCQIRVAWGARRAANPNFTIEHVADIQWISVFEGRAVNAQIGGMFANQTVLGNSAEDHPRFERFGGTQEAVKWSAEISTSGSFNAIWYKPHNGQLVERVPQNHPMRWYADCVPAHTEPLYPPAQKTEADT